MRHKHNIKSDVGIFIDIDEIYSLITHITDMKIVPGIGIDSPSDSLGLHCNSPECH